MYNSLQTILHPPSHSLSLSLSFSCRNYFLCNVIYHMFNCPILWVCTRIAVPVSRLEYWVLELCWHVLLAYTSAKRKIHDLINIGKYWSIKYRISNIISKLHHIDISIPTRALFVYNSWYHLNMQWYHFHDRKAET